MTYHSATAVGDVLPGGVLLVVVTGTLTTSAVRGIRAQIRATPGLLGACGVVIDYTRAIIAFGDDAGGDASDVVFTMGPVAILAPASCLDVFSSHCRRMAGAGIVRQIFTELSAAVDWARLEAALR